MSDTTILQGPDGRLYEIPNQHLEAYAVPGERVAELRRRLAHPPGAHTPTSEGAAMNANARRKAAAPGPGVAPPAEPGATSPNAGALPPGHAAAPPASMSLHPAQGVVLNFYFGATPPGGGPHLPFVVGAEPSHGSSHATVEPYHMTFDESGIPVNHTDMLWGDYIDKQGNPAVGWHSHDPITGNAQ